MAGRLVTVARFDQAVEAQIARSALEAAGIPVALNNEETSSLFGSPTAAFGGIKLVVREEDEEQAVKVLDETFGGEHVSDQELAAEAEATSAEETVDAVSQPSQPDEVEHPLSERDKAAQRALLATIFGLFVPLLLFYALYLFRRAAFGEGPLSKSSKNKLFLISVPLLVLSFFMACVLLTSVLTLLFLLSESVF